MHLSNYILLILFIVQNIILAQGYEIKQTGMQTFYFQDPQNRNQIIFKNEALVETFNGMTTDIWGEISFDPDQLQETLRGKISTTVKSIQTGIEVRDEDLRSERWLDAKEYPEISFEVTKVQDVVQLANNKLLLSVVGDFSFH
jgi:polyisoprenoid-binding protein YceI